MDANNLGAYPRPLSSSCSDSEGIEESGRFDLQLIDLRRESIPPSWPQSVLSYRLKLHTGKRMIVVLLWTELDFQSVLSLLLPLVGQFALYPWPGRQSYDTEHLVQLLRQVDGLQGFELR